MKNLMEYKGYYARIKYNSEDNCFFGTIAGIADVISFEGSSVAQLQEAFTEAVEDYLDLCMRHGKEPQKAYKGSFNVRINPELHKHAMLVALSDDIPLSQLVERAVTCYIQDEIKSAASEK
ncbi:MAG: type II toxin-antitoxin system HicB family antitoxin [Bacillota bacterium]|nr:type II toxin-antitoxin system HicB family antitoxin [Bacillota bacterium]